MANQEYKESKSTLKKGILNWKFFEIRLWKLISIAEDNRCQGIESCLWRYIKRTQENELFWG
jgi:hypothetical protein